MIDRIRVLGGLLVLLVAAVPAAEDWRLVVKLQGQVQSSVDNQKTWQPVFAQRLLRDNDAARTQADSKARIQLPDGSVAIMAPNTTAVLREYDQQQGKVKIYVETGGVRAKVTKAFGRGRFELNTRNGVLAAQGTDYAILYEDPNNVVSFVYEGVVSFQPPQGDTVFLRPGDSARLGPGGVIQVNPPNLNSSALPPILLPDPPEQSPKEAGSYTQATSGTTPGLRFGQLNGTLLPTDAGRIGTNAAGGPLSGLPGNGPNNPANPANPPGQSPAAPPNGVIQVDIRF